MKFEEIENLLGHGATEIERTIASVLASPEVDHNTVCALRVFLVGMLAAIVTTKTYLPLSEQLAAEDAAQLHALVKKIKEITPQTSAQAPSAVAVDRRRSRSGTERAPPQPFATSAADRCGSVAQLSRPRARGATGAAEPSNVIPFRAAARQPQPAEAASATDSKSMSHATCLSAARNAIARKKELTAQKREVLARSLALLAKSQSLRTSLDAVQLGRHY